jgi:hypothetical protein
MIDELANELTTVSGASEPHSEKFHVPLFVAALTGGFDAFSRIASSSPSRY